MRVYTHDKLFDWYGNAKTTLLFLDKEKTSRIYFFGISIIILGANSIYILSLDVVVNVEHTNTPLKDQTASPSAKKPFSLSIMFLRSKLFALFDFGFSF